MDDRSRQDSADLLAISEVLRGDKEAFRGVVDRYQGMILRLCAGFLGNEDEADEAAQDIFFKAFRSLHTFSLEKRFLPWLYSIALNHLRSRYGKLRAMGERSSRKDPDASVDSRAANPLDSAVRAEALGTIRHAVAGLPAALREVVTLYYYEELSVDQVSATLGIGRENVKSRLLRARRKLKEALGGATETGEAKYYSREGDEDGG